VKYATYDDIFVNDKNTRSFRPLLAAVTGDGDRAIIINQIEFYINLNKMKNKTSTINHFRKGRWWMFNTLSNWKREFFWIPERTLRRHFEALKKQGILITDNSLNDKCFDKTTWYSIDHDLLLRLCNEKYEELVRAGIYEAVDGGTQEGVFEAETAENVENTHMSKMATSNVPNWPNRDVQNGQTNTIYKPITDTNVNNIGLKDINIDIKAVGCTFSGKPSKVTRNRKSDFDISLEKSLTNMRKAVSDSQEYEAMKCITEHFFSAVALRTLTVHHVLSVKQCERIYENLVGCYEPVNAYTEDIIWQMKRYLNDFASRTDAITMEHFASAGILEVGTYELQRRTLDDEYIDYRACYIGKHPGCLMDRERKTNQILASAT